METFVADGIFIDSQPERVFRGLLDPEDVVEWMGAETVSIRAEVGGEVRIELADGTARSGRIGELRPGEYARIDDYYWHGDGEKQGPMRLSFTLEPRHGGVWITARQEGLDCIRDWKSFAEATRREWNAATVAMKRHIDQI